MFKVIGVVAVLATVGLGVAHYTGHLKLSGKVDVTNKGHALMDKSIDEAQELTNKGFDALRDNKNTQANQK